MSTLPGPHLPHLFKDRRPSAANLNVLMEERATVGERAADRLASVIGSWRFIIIQSAMLALWAALNVVGWIGRWDPYPFILMNLVLSLQAAFAGPVIMMSQNRQAARDRLEAHVDYEVNTRAEEEIGAVLAQLAAQDRAMAEMRALLAEACQRLRTLSPADGPPPPPAAPPPSAG